MYTALFGGYDKLRSPRVMDPACDYVCFTDDPNLRSDDWLVKFVSVVAGGGAQLANRHYKFFPHVYLSQYEASLYVDSNVELLDSPVGLFSLALGRADMCCAKHPLRDCAYDEIQACVNEGKITSIESEALTARLHRNGFPRSYGLFENNVIIRNHRSAQVAALMAAWWEMFEAGPRRDQLTLPYLAWQLSAPVCALIEASTRSGGGIFRYHLHSSSVEFSIIRKLWLTWKARHLATRTFAFVSALRSLLLR